MKDTRFFGLPNAADYDTSNPSMALGTDEWVAKLDRKPQDRTQEDIAGIFAALQGHYALHRLPVILVKCLSQYGMYESVEKNVTVFREGEDSRNFYIVLEGRLRVIRNGQNYVISKGVAFEEITGYDNKRKLTVVTKELCTLIRLERKYMKMFCKSHPYQLKDVVDATVLELDQIERLIDVDGDSETLVPPRITVDQSNLDGETANSNTADAILESAVDDGAPIKPRTPPVSEQQASLLLSSIIEAYPDYVRPQLGRKHCITSGHLMHYIEEVTQSTSKQETIGICQVLLEDAVIKQLDRKTEYVDFQTNQSFVYYFPNVSPLTAIDEDDLQSLLDDLIRRSTDALLRMTLRKPPLQRTVEDVEFIYNELVHIKAVAHLSTMIKRELARVVLLESHNSAGTVLFRQGDEGTSWFIILKGSVNVVIYGKGVVTTLQEGDDFGKLALVNDAPRAASIILREPCHFLRVDKSDFNRILKDVEANTVRLKEHGKDVLVLERIVQSTIDRGRKREKTQRYSVMAGTAEKVLEYLLETRMDEPMDDSDGLLEDYLLTYELFSSTPAVCDNLLRFYNSKIKDSNDETAKARLLANRKHVLNFVNAWYTVDMDVIFQKEGVKDFLQNLLDCVLRDKQIFPELEEGAAVVEELNVGMELYLEEVENAKVNINSEPITNDSENVRRIRPSDESVVKVFNADGNYSTFRITADTQAGSLMRQAAKKFGVENQAVLAEIKSNGEYSIYDPLEVSVESKLSVNGRLFCCTKEQLSHLNPLPEQMGATEPSGKILETVSSKELAYHCTLYETALFKVVHESELLHHISGRKKGITNNLDRVMTRFSVLVNWVATEIVLTSSQSKRVQLIKKFIKMAAHCKEYHNFFAFSAIIMGLTNSAVSRMTSTWEKVPAKMLKMMREFEGIIDPSRNHRASRNLMMTMKPPMVPFMPLVMKDLTFTNEGNKTEMDNMINFEKMHMMAGTLKIIRFSQSSGKPIQAPTETKSHELNVAAYVRNLRVIDNQRRLNNQSNKAEPRK